MQVFRWTLYELIISQMIDLVLFKINGDEREYHATNSIFYII
jgi:hypothetical protein